MQECETALQRIKAGDNFSRVARETSQGGSKNLGGILGKRYLDIEDHNDQFLSSLSQGETSPAIEVDNGFWCYLVQEKGPPELLPLEQIPWPARRIIFRKVLAETMAEVK